MVNLPTIDMIRTEYKQAAEAGRVICKGSAGHFRICYSAGDIQVAAGCNSPDHR